MSKQFLTFTCGNTDEVFRVVLKRHRAELYSLDPESSWDPTMTEEEEMSTFTVKCAVFPFKHFWLGTDDTVAPAPISVLFLMNDGSYRHVSGEIVDFRTKSPIVAYECFFSNYPEPVATDAEGFRYFPDMGEVIYVSDAEKEAYIEAHYADHPHITRPEVPERAWWYGILFSTPDDEKTKIDAVKKITTKK